MATAENPVQVLIEEQDPVRRSRAHLTLGRRAMDRQDVGAAREHLREAMDLDPTDEVPRRLLEQLGSSRKPRSWWPF
jgi:hypothetical protein